MSAARSAGVTLRVRLVNDADAELVCFGYGRNDAEALEDATRRAHLRSRDESYRPLEHAAQ